MSTRPQPQADSTLDEGFIVGDLRVNPANGELAGRGSARQLDPKVMAVLVYMAKHAGQVVTRDDLMTAVWPGVLVSDDALSRCFYELRRELSLAGGSDEFKALIETLPKRGYRLTGDVSPLPLHAQTPAYHRPAIWLAAGLVATLAVVIGYRVLAPPTQPEPQTAKPIYAIAVLPFVDMSEKKDQRYFSDGTAEEILNRLAQSSDLRVIARTSSFTFRDTPYDVTEIGRRLNVTHVLEGSVRKSGDRVRVTAQLIAASDGSHVWSDTFERKLGDVFAIQDEVSAAVAAALATTLTGKAPSSRPPSSLEAYDLVLQGEYLYWRRAPGDMDIAVNHFEEAVKLDPAYSRAWANLAAAYYYQSWGIDPQSTMLRAKQGNAALRAVELDPWSGVAHRRLADYYGDMGDIESYKKHIALAHKLDPDNTLMISDRAWTAVDSGRFEEGIALQRDALLRDPLNSVSRKNLGVMQIAAGHLDDALVTYRMLLETNPGLDPDARADIPRILVLLGQLDDAAAEVMLVPAGKSRDQALALLHSLPAKQDDANAALRRLEIDGPTPQGTRENRVIDTLRLAEIYAYRGQPDAALTTLSKARDELAAQPDSDAYLWVLRTELRLSPFLKPLQDDSRWQQLMAKLDAVVALPSEPEQQSSEQ